MEKASKLLKKYSQEKPASGLKKTKLRLLRLHVELPDERCHVGVFVVVGEEAGGELCLVVDDEAVSLVVPRDQVGRVRVVDHLPQLGQEGWHVRYDLGKDDLKWHFCYHSIKNMQSSDCF